MYIHIRCMYEYFYMDMYPCILYGYIYTYMHISMCVCVCYIYMNTYTYTGQESDGTIDRQNQRARAICTAAV